MEKTRKQRLREGSAERRSQQKLELRGAILTAASELFLAHGYSGFSLRAVAERVGYSPTTVYLYFENKDALLFAVVLEGFEHFGGALQRAYESEKDPLKRIGAIGRAYIAFGVQHPAHYRLMFMERGDFLLKQDPESQSSTIDSFGILVRAVHEAHAGGQLRAGDPMAYVYTLWAGVHGLVALTLCVPVLGEADLEARTDHMLSVLHGGIASNMTGSEAERR